MRKRVGIHCKASQYLGKVSEEKDIEALWRVELRAIRFVGRGDLRLIQLGGERGCRHPKHTFGKYQTITTDRSPVQGGDADAADTVRKQPAIRLLSR